MGNQDDDGDNMTVIRQIGFYLMMSELSPEGAGDRR